MVRDLNIFKDDVIHDIFIFSWQLLASYSYLYSLCFTQNRHLESLCYKTIKTAHRINNHKSKDDTDFPLLGYEGMELELLNLVSIIIPKEIEASKKQNKKPLFEQNFSQFLWLLCNFLLIRYEDFEQFLPIILGKSENKDEEPFLLNAYDYNIKEQIWKLNNFVSLEHDDSTKNSIRNVVINIIGDLLQMFPEGYSVLLKIYQGFMDNTSFITYGNLYKNPIIVGDMNYCQFYYESSHKLHSIFKKEAGLFIFEYFSHEFFARNIINRTICIKFIENALIPYMKKSNLEVIEYADFFCYRSICLTNSLLQEFEIDEKLSKQLLECIINLICDENTNFAVKLIACNILKYFKKSINLINSESDFEKIHTGICNLLKKTNSDTCIFVLNGINEICKIQDIQQYAKIVCNLLNISLNCFKENHGETEISDKILSLYTTLLDSNELLVQHILHITTLFIYENIGKIKISAENESINIAILEIINFIIPNVFTNKKPINQVFVVEFQEIFNIISNSINTCDMKNSPFLISVSSIIRSFFAYSYESFSPVYFLLFVSKRYQKEIIEKIILLCKNYNPAIHTDLGFLIIHMLEKTKSIYDISILIKIVENLQNTNNPNIVLVFF